MRQVNEMENVAETIRFSRIIDISMTIDNGMPVYPGDSKVDIAVNLSIKKGDTCNMTTLKMGSHCGTHIDAPLHFIDGAAGVDEIPLERFAGYADVVEIDDECITAKHLVACGIGNVDDGGDDNDGRCNIVLFKTPNSKLAGRTTFSKRYSYLAHDGAEYLIKCNKQLVGIDYLSIEDFDSSEYEVHQTLLSHGMIILEGIDLSGVDAGRYYLMCFPLKIKGGDGAPVRAVLLQC